MTRRDPNRAGDTVGQQVIYGLIFLVGVLFVYAAQATLVPVIAAVLGLLTGGAP